MKRNFLFFLFIVITTICFAQTDSTHRFDKKWYGNSWNFNAQYSFSYYNELSFNIGRTQGLTDCGCIGCIYSSKTVGIGVSKLFHPENNNTYLMKAYGEIAITSFMFPFVLRTEYNYIPQFKQHFIKPEFGFSFLYADITYSYAINLNKNVFNPIQHGLNLRIKLYTNVREWLVNERRMKVPISEKWNVQQLIF